MMFVLKSERHNGHLGISHTGIPCQATIVWRPESEVKRVCFSAF